MSEITNKQNLQDSIDYLIAQRYYYSLAKKYRGTRLFLSTLLALLSPVLVLIWPSLIPILATIGGLWTIIAYSFKEFMENNYISKASIIQEEFDVSLFKLDWNSVLVGNKVSPEEISRANRKFKGEVSKLRNWYGDLSGIPYPLDVLLCQRSNLVWDWRLKRSYSFSILSITLVYFILTIILSCISELELSEYILGLFLPALSGYLFSIDEFVKHYKASTKRKELETRIQSLSEETNPKLLKISELRQIQDCIYDFRKGPPIPDWFYYFRRNTYESDMRAALDRFKNKIKQSSVNKN